MECQTIIELLSPYLDGELEPSEIKFVDEHLEHCHRCRKELMYLQEISFVLQELPEITPPPDFHAGLQSKLAKVTTAAAAETVKQKVSPLQYFVNGTWSKVSAFAAALILAFGITALWYPDGLGVKIKPVQERHDVLSEIPQSRQSVSKETGALEKRNNIIASDSSDLKVSEDIQSAVRTNPDAQQKENSQTNYTPVKYKETNIVASELPRETGAMKIQSVPENIGNEDIPDVIPSEVTRAKDPALYDRVETFAAAELDPKITADDVVEETGQGEQLLGQGKSSQKFMIMQLEVEDIENAIAEIYILSQNNNAAAEVQQNKVLIVVPAANYAPLTEQIESLGQIISKELNEDFTDQELNQDQNFSEQQNYTISLELE